MMDGYCSITCGACGHIDSLDVFCRTPIFGDLPKNHYQCPACHLATERRMERHSCCRPALLCQGRLRLLPFRRGCEEAG